MSTPPAPPVPDYRARFTAQDRDVTSAVISFAVDQQAQRIRHLAALVTADELLAVRRKIKPALQKGLSESDLHEMALILADADKREKLWASDAERSVGEVVPADVYQMEEATDEPATAVGIVKLEEVVGALGS